LVVVVLRGDERVVAWLGDVVAVWVGDEERVLFSPVVVTAVAALGAPGFVVAWQLAVTL
jgi:hypothetical protein